jgi:hypothetical protein
MVAMALLLTTPEYYFSKLNADSRTSIGKPIVDNNRKVESEKVGRQ